MAKLFERVDVLVAPTTWRKQVFTTNMSGHPSIALPNGFDDKNLPTSFSIVGNLFDEERILGLAETYQLNTSYHKQHPPLFGVPR